MKRIQLKSSLFWALGTDTIYVYFNNPNLRKEIHSNNNIKLFSLLKFLIAPKSQDEIDYFCYKNKISDIEKSDILNFLNAHGYLENDLTLYNKNELNSRIINFISTFPSYSYFQYSHQLNETNICIIGLGTAGSHIVELLVKMQFKNLTLIDHDIVQMKNIFSQNFVKEDLGKYKVEALYKKISNIKDHNTNIFCKKISNYSELKRTVDLGNINFLIISADDFYLTIDILENIFIEFPSIKIIQTGYSLLNIQLCVINSTNYQEYVKHIKGSLKTYKELDEIIIANTGSILDSYFIAFFATKIILDYTISNESDLFFSFDYLTNNFNKSK